MWSMIVKSRHVRLERFSFSITRHRMSSNAKFSRHLQVKQFNEIYDMNSWIHLLKYETKSLTYEIPTGSPNKLQILEI